MYKEPSSIYTGNDFMPIDYFIENADEIEHGRSARDHYLELTRIFIEKINSAVASNSNYQSLKKELQLISEERQTFLDTAERLDI